MPKHKYSYPKRTKRRRGRPPILSILNFKVSRKDRKAMIENAEQACGGNLSEWLRWAGTQKPPVVRKR